MNVITRFCTCLRVYVLTFTFWFLKKKIIKILVALLEAVSARFKVVWYSIHQLIKCGVNVYAVLINYKCSEY